MAAGALVWVLVFALFTGHDLLGAIVAGVAALAAWWCESRLWGEVDCWWPFCRGGIVSYSPFTRNARRRCRVCGGSGKRRRVLAGSGR